MTLEQKVDKVLESQTEMKVELAKSLVHQENHAKKLIEHESKIGVLNDHKNNSTGRNVVISALAGTSFGGFVAWVIKHL